MSQHEEQWLQGRGVPILLTHLERAEGGWIFTFRQNHAEAYRLEQVLRDLDRVNLFGIGKVYHIDPQSKKPHYLDQWFIRDEGMWLLAPHFANWKEMRTAQASRSGSATGEKRCAECGLLLTSASANKWSCGECGEHFCGYICYCEHKTTCARLKARREGAQKWRKLWDEEPEPAAETSSHKGQSSTDEQETFRLRLSSLKRQADGYWSFTWEPSPRDRTFRLLLDRWRSEGTYKTAYTVDGYSMTWEGLHQIRQHFTNFDEMFLAAQETAWRNGGSQSSSTPPGEQSHARSQQQTHSCGTCGMRERDSETMHQCSRCSQWYCGRHFGGHQEQHRLSDFFSATRWSRAREGSYSFSDLDLDDLIREMRNSRQWRFATGNTEEWDTAFRDSGKGSQHQRPGSSSSSARPGSAGPSTSAGSSAGGSRARPISFEVHIAFQTLGVTASEPTRQQIDAAYKAKKKPLRQQARQYHPDTGSSQEAKMKQISDAINQIDKAFVVAMAWVNENQPTGPTEQGKG